MKTETEYEPVDDAFGKPFVDVDEWRDSPRRHRYLHGGFEGTETLSPTTSLQRSCTADASSRPWKAGPVGASSRSRLPSARRRRSPS
jgi:hypothetical protein